MSASESVGEGKGEVSEARRPPREPRAAAPAPRRGQEACRGWSASCSRRPTHVPAMRRAVAGCRMAAAAGAASPAQLRCTPATRARALRCCSTAPRQGPHWPRRAEEPPNRAVPCMGLPLGSDEGGSCQPALSDHRCGPGTPPPPSAVVPGPGRGPSSRPGCGRGPSGNLCPAHGALGPAPGPGAIQAAPTTTARVQGPRPAPAALACSGEA